MLQWLHRLTEQDVRYAVGARFEAFVDEAFQVVRWAGMVAVADYLARRYPDPYLSAVYWILAALLFGYVASRFLLRPEISLFGPGATRWQRLLQSAVNFLVCVVAFGAVLATIGTITERMTEQQLGR